VVLGKDGDQLDRLFEIWILLRTKNEKNVLHITRRRKPNWIGYILRRNCLMKHVVLGKREETRRGGRKCEQLLDDFKEKRRHWKLKDEALDRTL